MTIRAFHLPGPIRLTATVGPATVLGVGTTRYDGNTVWRASRTPDGPGTVRITVRGLEAEAEGFGPGGAWLIEHAPDLLGAADRPEEFVTDHPLIRTMVRRTPDLRIAKTSRIFEALVPAILGQKVTTIASKRSLSGLLKKYGEPAPGPVELRVLPDPAVLAALPYYEYHPLGVERKRAETIRRTAARAERLESLLDESCTSAAGFLTKLPGVGPWTAALVTGAAMGDPDAVPVGDFHIPNLVAFALAGEDRGDDARMLELLEPFAGQRGRVIRLIKASGMKAPKYGPRMAPRSIASL